MGFEGTPRFRLVEGDAKGTPLFSGGGGPLCYDTIHMLTSIHPFVPLSLSLSLSFSLCLSLPVCLCLRVSISLSSGKYLKRTYH